MKRITILLISVLLVFSTFSVAAEEYYDSSGRLCENIDGFLFRIKGDTAVLSGVIPECYERETLLIPNKIEGIRSISIETGVFNTSVKAKEIVISNLVTEISHNAFVGCPNLRIINFPSSVMNLESPIIKNCRKLEYIVLDSGFSYQLFDKGLIDNLSRKELKKITIVSEFNSELIVHLKNIGFVDFITPENVKNQDMYIFLTECRDILSSSEIKVSVDAEFIDFDVPPTVINERTMVPLRAVFEKIGANVEWNDVSRVARISLGESEVEFSPDVLGMVVNGKKVSLDVSPQIIDGRVLVPVRAISEALECEVYWDEDLRIVAIYASPEKISLDTSENALYHDNEFKIYASSYEPYKYVSYLVDNGYYILTYNSYGDCILKNGNKYVAFALCDFGRYVLEWNADEMDLETIEMNMMIMDTSNYGTTSSGGNGGYNNGFSSNGNNYSSSDSVSNLTSAALLAEIAEIEIDIQKLQSKLYNIMTERNVRMLIDGEWKYTYDHQAAAAVREQIENLQLKLSIYKQSLN